MDAFIHYTSNSTLLRNVTYYQSAEVESAILDYYRFKRLMHLQTWVICVQVIIGGFALIGNLINVFIFTRPHMRSPINILCGALEAVNVFVILTICHGLLLHAWDDYKSSEAAMVITLIVGIVCRTCIFISNWITFNIGLWRFIEINWPLKFAKSCTTQKAKMSICIIAMVGIIKSIPSWFMGWYEVAYKVAQDNQSAPILHYDFTFSKYAKLHGIWLRKLNTVLGLFDTTIPCFCLAVMTIMLLQCLWRAKKSRKELGRTYSNVSLNMEQALNQKAERRITISLTVMVLVFLLAYTPSGIYNIMHFIFESNFIISTWYYPIYRSAVSILLGNALTIFFYCYMSERYRNTLSNVICCTPFLYIRKKCRLSHKVTTADSSKI